MSFYHFGRAVVKFVLCFRYHISVINSEILPTGKGKGFIVASNHTTYGDPLFIGIGYKGKVCFMAKEELFHNPILGFLIKHFGAFPVSRGKGDQGAITSAVSIVKSGGVLGIFPEGTRSKDGTLGRAKSGTVLVAAKTGGDIYPVGIYYGKKRFIRQQLTVTYGEPIKNKSLGLHGEEIGKTELKEASALVMEAIAKAIEVGKTARSRIEK